MKKALSVTIGGIIFTIEDDVFNTLDLYLKEVREYFLKNEDREEIIADIELGLADKLRTSLKTGKQVITQEDVKNAITQMGTVNDFKKSEGEEKKEKEENIIGTVQSFFHQRIKGKQLFRDVDNRVIEGVCAGLGIYFGIDPVFVRILFVALVFTPLAPLSLIGYFVLLIVVPPAKTRIDRMRMSGEEITLSSFSTEEKKEGTATHANSHIARLIMLPFRALGIVLRGMGKIIPFCINIVMGISIFGALCIAIGISILGGVFVLFRNTFVFDGPLSTFPSSFFEYLFIGSSYCAAILTLTYCIILGISIIKRKYILNGWITAGFVGTWTLFIILSGIFGAGISLRVAQEYRSQPVKEQVITPTLPFSSLSLSTNIDEFEVIQGEKQQVILTGTQKDLDKINVTVNEQGELTLKRNSHNKTCIFCGYSGDVRAQIITPRLLSTISVDKPVHGTISGEVITPSSTFILENSAHITVNSLEGQEVSAALQSGSRLTLKGAATTLIARVYGSSFLEAESFSVNSADIAVFDVGKASVDAIETLKGSTEEDGAIYYVATPEIVATESTSIKKIIRGEIFSD